MSSIPCDYPNCTLSAKEKCASCGNIYCVKHIQLVSGVYLCDLCIAKSAEREIFRMDVQEASVGRLLKNASCVVTNKRIILSERSGGSAQILFSEVNLVSSDSTFDILRMLHTVNFYTRGRGKGDSVSYWLRFSTPQECERMALKINQTIK